MHRIVQLTRTGMRYNARRTELTAAQEQFRRHHFLKLPGFLDKPMLKFLQNEVLRAGSVRYSDEGGSESEICGNAGFLALLFFMNHPDFFHLVERFTGCSKISSFVGRGYHLDAGGKDAMKWHDDKLDGRLVAMSVNLGKGPHEGGLLQMREKNNPKKIWKVPNQRPGDAVIFKVSGVLEHQVTSVVGKSPKTAFAGWFRSKGKLFDCF